MNIAVMGQRTAQAPAWIGRLACAGALLAVAAMIWQGWQQTSPVVSRVQITGSFHYLDEARLRAAIAPELGRPFFSTDVDAIRDAVAALPWVAEVRVRRGWPDRLHITVREHRPVARWGEHAVLSEALAVLEPDRIPDGLPLLDGPMARRGLVLERWQALSEALSGTPLALASLRMDERGAWHATTRDGVELRLGRGEPLRHLGLLTRVLPAALAQTGPVRYVDLRYENGFAIGHADAEGH